MEQTKTILRWIAVLPGAALGLFLSYALIKIFTGISNWFIGVSQDSPYMHIADNIFFAGLSGFAFVYFGCKIAPSQKKIVAYGLTGIILIIGGMALPVAISSGSFWNILADIFPGIGGIFALYQINSGELNVEGDVLDFN